MLGSVDPTDLAAAEAAVQLVFANDDWVGALIAPMVEGLWANPFFAPPFRVSRDRLRLGAVLFDCPAVSIAATILSADTLASLPAPNTVIVSGRVSIVRYFRGGGARLRLWRTEPAGADFSAATACPCVPLGVLPIADGVVLRLDGRTRGHLLENAASDVVMLTATLRAGAAPFAREFALPEGALVRVATLDDRAARAQMLLALLRLSGRTDASECFEAATHDGSFSHRWGAMREWLALDAAAALPRLRAMTQDPNDEVRTAATATLILVEQRMAAACHA